MCGRFVLFGNDDDMQDLFELDQLLGLTVPSYNIAPTQPIRVIMEHYADQRVRVMTDATWGLVPSWAKPGFRPMINARAETVTEKPSFRERILRMARQAALVSVRRRGRPPHGLCRHL